MENKDLFENKNIDMFLPYGEYIRIISQQNAISQGEIKRVLRQRGVLFGNPSKENTVPFLANILLSPSEFNYLRGCFNTREDTEKITSSTPMDWLSDKNIIECVPKINTDEYFKGQILNYKLRRKPSYRKIDDNTAIIDFEIERRDRNKSFIEQKNNYKGSVTIQKKDNKVSFVTTTTSPESKKIAQFISNETAKHLKTKGYIQKEKIHKLKFSDFNNVDRWVFLWRLSRDNESLYLNFNDVIDISFTPDKNKGDFPKDIDWMQKQKSLIMKGEDIHDVFFIKNTEYYNHLIVCEMEVEFKFQLRTNSGRCTFNFGFPEYNGRRKINNNAEFEMKIVKLISDNKLDSIAKKRLNTELLKLMDSIKTKVYLEY